MPAMLAIACLWRPVLAGALAFCLTFVVHTLAVLVWGAPAGLAMLTLLPASLAEAGKLLFLGLAGGPAHWPMLGAAFGLCQALLQLLRPEAPLAVSLANAAAAVLLSAALGGIAAVVARRTGRRLLGFGLALLLHGLIGLVGATAALALARHQGVPLGTAGAYAGLVLSVALALVAGRYSAASRVVVVLAENPKASASSR